MNDSAIVPPTPLINDASRFEVAKLHLDRLWQEVFWRRETEQKVCVWIVGIFIAVLALLYGKDDSAKFETQHRFLLSLLPLVLGLMGAYYLYINAGKNKEIARVIVKLNRSLGSWTVGYLVEGELEHTPDATLLPGKWQRWGGDEDHSGQTFRNDKVSFLYFVLVLFAMIVCVVGIWLQ